MTLDFGPNGKAVVERRFAPVFFKGEWETHCSLHAGPIRDLNVMVARDLVRADIGVQRLGWAPPGSQLMRPAAGGCVGVADCLCSSVVWGYLGERRGYWGTHIDPAGCRKNLQGQRGTQ